MVMTDEELMLELDLAVACREIRPDTMAEHEASIPEVLELYDVNFMEWLHSIDIRLTPDVEKATELVATRRVGYMRIGPPRACPEGRYSVLDVALQKHRIPVCCEPTEAQIRRFGLTKEEGGWVAYIPTDSFVEYTVGEGELREALAR